MLIVNECVIMGNGRERNTYLVESCHKQIKVAIKYEEYVASSALAVSLYARPDELYEIEDENLCAEEVNVFSELYAVITVNLPDSVLLPAGVQYVDVNNYPWICDWLIDNKIAEPTEYSARSGFCVYPAMKFNRNCADDM